MIFLLTFADNSYIINCYVVEFCGLLNLKNIQYGKDKNMNEFEGTSAGTYLVIKALEDGVSIIGLTRGKDTRLHHTEKLDKGEVYIAQFTEVTSAIKLRGKAKIYCQFGEIESGE